MKKPDKMTDAEALRELFPAKVRRQVKKEIEKAEKRAPDPAKKPEKSADRR